jgi:hypothetical protein
VKKIFVADSISLLKVTQQETVSQSFLGDVAGLRISRQEPKIIALQNTPTYS